MPSSYTDEEERALRELILLVLHTNNNSVVGGTDNTVHVLLSKASLDPNHCDVLARSVIGKMLEQGWIQRDGFGSHTIEIRLVKPLGPMLYQKLKNQAEKNRVIVTKATTLTLIPPAGPQVHASASVRPQTSSRPTPLSIVPPKARSEQPVLPPRPAFVPSFPAVTPLPSVAEAVDDKPKEVAVAAELPEYELTWRDKPTRQEAIRDLILLALIRSGGSVDSEIGHATSDLYAAVGVEIKQLGPKGSDAFKFLADNAIIRRDTRNMRTYSIELLVQIGDEQVAMLEERLAENKQLALPTGKKRQARKPEPPTDDSSTAPQEPTIESNDDETATDPAPGETNSTGESLSAGRQALETLAGEISNAMEVLRAHLPDDKSTGYFIIEDVLRKEGITNPAELEYYLEELALVRSSRYVGDPTSLLWSVSTTPDILSLMEKLVVLEGGGRLYDPGTESSVPDSDKFTTEVPRKSEDPLELASPVETIEKLVEKIKDLKKQIKDLTAENVQLRSQRFEIPDGLKATVEAALSD